MSSGKISVGLQVSGWIQQGTCCQDLVFLRGFPTQVRKAIWRTFSCMWLLLVRSFHSLVAQEQILAGKKEKKKRKNKEKENKELSTWVTVWVAEYGGKKVMRTAKIAVLRPGIPRRSFPLCCGKEMDEGLLGLVFSGDRGGSGIWGPSRFWKQTFNNLLK